MASRAPGSFRRAARLDGLPRRGFLADLLHAPLVVVPAGWATTAGVRQSTQGSWETMAAIQNHLLPSQPGTLGAEDVGAVLYLRRVLQLPQVTDAEWRFVWRGLERLALICEDLYGVAFEELSSGQRELALRTMELDRNGVAWLVEQTGFVLEVLFGGHSHSGGDGVEGWRCPGVRPACPPSGTGAP